VLAAVGGLVAVALLAWARRVPLECHNHCSVAATVGFRACAEDKEEYTPTGVINLHETYINGYYSGDEQGFETVSPAQSHRLSRRQEYRMQSWLGYR
jgi:hypothetical protein